MKWGERVNTARYFLRRALARLPYVPVPVRFQIAPGQTIGFWWSRVSPYFDPRRGFFDYWGQDIDDLRLVWKSLKPGMVFLDIGAHHGIFSVVAAKRMAGEGQVIAFEPSPREHRRLNLHFRWNGLRCARAEQIAVGSDCGESPFFEVVEGDATRGGLRPPESGDAVVGIPVKTISLDQYVSEQRLPRVDFIKLDVEGGELEVIQGAIKILTEHRPVVLCEVLDAATRPWGYAARQIILSLQAHGFNWYELNSDGSPVPHAIRDEYPQVRNYLAVPREKRLPGKE